MSRPITNQQGFTLVELLIATTIFSVILMAAAAALVQMGRLYYKGVIAAKTQNVTRTVIDDVSRSIQFSSGNDAEATLPGDATVKAKCFGDIRFTYILREQVGPQVPHALWQDKIGAAGCDEDVPDLRQENPYGDPAQNSQGRELLSKGMRLQDFNIQAQAGSNDDIFIITVKVIYGENDLLNDPDNPTACKGSTVGGQWCAISDLSSVVYSRAQ